MKVIHILKRMETIDLDIKDLRKMEKSLAKNKSFTTPIYMSIEKQINILLGERVKLLELQIKDPPPDLVKTIEGPGDDSDEEELTAEAEEEEEEEDKKPAKKTKKSKSKKSQPKSAKPKKKELDDDIDIPIMTQDTIDERMENIRSEEDTKIFDSEEENIDDYVSDESVKLLDVALERGSLQKDEIDKEKKKVKFFKDNFPSR